MPEEKEKPLRVCAWCDRKLNDKNEAEGPVIPKSEQKGSTHGACKSCYKKLLDEMD